MTPTFPLNPEIARSGPIYRQARLALLEHELMRSFEDTDAAATWQISRGPWAHILEKRL
jgi:hypothetical protein